LWKKINGNISLFEVFAQISVNGYVMNNEVRHAFRLQNYLPDLNFQNVVLGNLKSINPPSFLFLSLSGPG
jgi:hypothetical protein